MAKLVIKAGLDTWPGTAKDSFIAAKISSLTLCGAEDISGSRKYLLNAFILNTTLAASLKNESRQLLFSFIRKTENAFNEYCFARANLIDYLKTADKTVTSYFQSLAHFENCIMHLYQASNHFSAILGKKIFEKGDGSFFERLNSIYNQVKHIEAYPELRTFSGMGSFESFIKYQNEFASMTRQEVGDLATTPTWITNDGIESKAATISFPELSGQIMEYYEEAAAIATHDVRQHEQ
jgi:hypothetical protein